MRSRGGGGGDAPSPRAVVAEDVIIQRGQEIPPRQMQRAGQSTECGFETDVDFAGDGDEENVEVPAVNRAIDVVEFEAQGAEGRSSQVNHHIYKLLAVAAEQDQLEELLSVSHLDQLSGVNAAFSLVNASKMIEAMGRRGTPAAEDTDIGEHQAKLLSAMWAFAKLSLPEPRPLLNALAASVEPRLEEFNNHSISTILWSFASAQVFHAPLFDALPAEIVGRASTLRPQELANVSWSYASVRKYQPELFRSLGDAAEVQMDEFRPQQISLVAWSFAMVQARHESVFRAIERDVIGRAESAYPAQSLANVLRAFVVLAHRSEPLFQAASRSIINRITEFKPQAIANVCWAFSGKNYVDQKLFDVIARESVARINTFPPSALTSLLLTFSRVHVSNEALFRAAATEAAPQLENFAAEAFVRLVRSFAVAGVVDAQFCNDLSRAVVHQSGSLNPADVVHLAKPFVMHGRNRPELLEPLALRAMGMLDRLGPKDLISIVCSLSALGLTTSSSHARSLYCMAAQEVMQRMMHKGERHHTFRLIDLAGFARALVQAASEAQRKNVSETVGALSLVAAVDAFFDVLAGEAIDRAKELTASPSALVAILWACMQRGTSCEVLLNATVDALSQPGVGVIERLRLSELQELVEAFTLAGVVRLSLFSAIAAAAATQLGRRSDRTFPADDLVAIPGLLWQFTIAGLMVPALATCSADQILWHAELATTRADVLPAWVIAWCIASLAISDGSELHPSALSRLAQAAMGRLGELRLEERAVVVWGLAVQGCYDNLLVFDTILRQTPWQAWASNPQEESTVKWGPIDSKITALSQVYLADLALRLEMWREGLPQDARRFCWEATLAVHRRRCGATSGVANGELLDGAPRQQAGRDEKAALIARVAHALTGFGQSPSINRITREGLGIDIQIHDVGAMRLCIDIESPAAFLRDVHTGGARRFSPNALRQRLLRRLGWVLVPVPWFDIASRSDEALVGFLQLRLSEALSRPLYQGAGAYGAGYMGSMSDMNGLLAGIGSPTTPPGPVGLTSDELEMKLAADAEQLAQPPSCAWSVNSGSGTNLEAWEGPPGLEDVPATDLAKRQDEAPDHAQSRHQQPNTDPLLPNPDTKLELSQEEHEEEEEEARDQEQDGQPQTKSELLQQQQPQNSEPGKTAEAPGSPPPPPVHAPPPPPWAMEGLGSLDLEDDAQTMQSSDLLPIEALSWAYNLEDDSESFGFGRSGFFGSLGEGCGDSSGRRAGMRTTGANVARNAALGEHPLVAGESQALSHDVHQWPTREGALPTGWEQDSVPTNIWGDTKGLWG
mmetsp:Transcript_12477/g.34396  ORF Transcript_12477/g.34396 Transcript_12477/m.34396 type:complete len:1306 (-) Transcript_12477:721-4638(-)